MSIDVEVTIMPEYETEVGAIECHVLVTNDSKNIEFDILKNMRSWNISQ